MLLSIYIDNKVVNSYGRDMLIGDTIDNGIRGQLRRGEATASDLARFLPYPRTTITYRLERLLSVHRVAFRVVGRCKLWRLATRPQQKKDLFQIFSGPDYYECYKVLLLTPPRSTVYAIQGGKAGKAVLASIPSYFLREAHALFKRRKIVLRSVAHRDVFGAFAGLSERMIRSHKERPQVNKVIEGALLSGGGELIASPHALLLTNAKQQRAILIKDREIVRLCHDTLELLHSLSDTLPRVP